MGSSYFICSICGGAFWGHGNNAEPYMDGVCCDECNRIYVIPYRLKQVEMKEVEADGE